MLDPLRLTGLAGDHGDGVWRGRSDHGVEKVVEKSEAVRVLPHKWSGIAIHMADDQFTLLHLRLCRDWSGIGSSIGAQRPAGYALFGKGIAVIVGHVARIQMKLGVDGGVAVIHGIRVLRKAEL